jgi:hypothetical protein
LPGGSSLFGPNLPRLNVCPKTHVLSLELLPAHSHNQTSAETTDPPGHQTISSSNRFRFLCFPLLKVSIVAQTCFSASSRRFLLRRPQISDPVQAPGGPLPRQQSPACPAPEGNSCAGEQALIDDPVWFHEWIRACIWLSFLSLAPLTIFLH